MAEKGQSKKASSPRKKKAKQPAKRNYTGPTIKILFAWSDNQCAHPDCIQPIIADATKHDDAEVIGQISHIHGASDDGPRPNPGLSEEARNHHSNLILLCPTHHAIADRQENTYTAETLLKWKADQERKRKARLSANISSLGYMELELAAKALESGAHSDSRASLITIPPEDKIERNQLGVKSALLLTMGAAKSQEVEAVLLNAAQLDPGFPDRLRDGFVQKYEELLALGLSGDDLFEGMYIWAAGDSGSSSREAAGLCTLTHLFILCDVFKK